MHQFARDILLTYLPDNLAGTRVLDVGCGEGIVTRAAAERRATVLGIDPERRMIENARAVEASNPTGAEFAIDDGCSLATVSPDSIDWVIASLSMNNVPDLSAAIRAVRWVLVVGGKLSFTVPHPCFEAPGADWIELGGTPRRVVGDYLVEGFWRSTNPHGVRRAGNQHRKLSTYVTELIQNGFVLEALDEPMPDERVVAEQPKRATVPPFVVINSRL